MKNVLRFGGLTVLVLLIVPIGTIYRQNIETWASDRGLDGMLSEGVVVLSTNPLGPWLLFAFVFVLGGTTTLWLEYFLRNKFPVKFHAQKSIIEGQTFRHANVKIDGKSFRDCSFDGVKLVYGGTGFYDFQNCDFGDFSIGVETDAAKGAASLFKLVQASGRPAIFEGDQPQSPKGIE